MQEMECQARVLQAAWLSRSEESVAEEVAAVEAALADAGFFDAVGNSEGQSISAMEAALEAEEVEFRATEARERALRSAWEVKKEEAAFEQAAVEEALFAWLDAPTPVAVTPVKKSKWCCVASEEFEWQPSPADAGFAAQLAAQDEADMMDPVKLLADMQLSRRDAALEVDSIFASVVEQRVDSAMRVERNKAEQEFREKELRKNTTDERATQEVEAVITDVLGSFCSEKAARELAQHRAMCQGDLGGLWVHWYEEVDSEEERCRARLLAKSEDTEKAVTQEGAVKEVAATAAMASLATPTPSSSTKSKRRVFGRLTRGPSVAELDGSMLKPEKPAACFRMDVGEGHHAKSSQERDCSLSRGYDSLGSALIFCMEEAPANRSLAQPAALLRPAKALQHSASDSALMLDLGIAPPQAAPPVAPPAPDGLRPLKRISSLGVLRADVAKSSLASGFSFSGSNAPNNMAYSFSSKAAPGFIASRGLLPMAADPLFSRRNSVDFALM